MPWLEHYDHGVPATLTPYRDRTILDCVADTAGRLPNHPAILFKGTAISYGELERLSDACAAALQSLGVARGVRVALLLPNCPQFLIVELAAWKLGAILAPLNPLYTEAELEAALGESGAPIAVVLTRFYERIKRVQPRTAVRKVVATNIKDYFPRLLKIVFTLFREKRDGDRISLRDGDQRLASLLHHHAGAKSARVPLKPQDPAVLLMSGGTTGTPKAALGTHGAYNLTGRQVAAWIGSVLRGHEDVWLVPLPLFHVYVNVGVQAVAFANGATLALIPNPRDLRDLLATIRKVKPAFFCAVPTLYVALLNHADARPGAIDFKSIRFCFCGASALLADTKRRFEALTGGVIVEGYSLTEAMMALCANPVKGVNKIGSVGMPFPDVLVRIYDAEEGTGSSNWRSRRTRWGPAIDGRLLNRMKVGVFGSRRPTALAATHGDPAIDDDGYLFIVDRKKRHDQDERLQVWPARSRCLATHAAVAEVGVAGVGSRKGRSFTLDRAPRGETATEDDCAFCRSSSPPQSPPLASNFAPAPRRWSAKVLRRVLRDSVTRPNRPDTDASGRAPRPGGRRRRRACHGHKSCRAGAGICRRSTDRAVFRHLNSARDDGGCVVDHRAGFAGTGGRPLVGAIGKCPATTRSCRGRLSKPGIGKAEQHQPGVECRRRPSVADARSASRIAMLKSSLRFDVCRR
jgi:long-chain acyl-CoA synthetase